MSPHPPPGGFPGRPEPPPPSYVRMVVYWLAFIWVVMAKVAIAVFRAAAGMLR